MTRIIIFIFSLVCCLTAKADLPGFAYQYDRYSENGRFYFKSIPFINYDLTNFGKTIIYDGESGKELYKIDNFLPIKTFISNTGKSLISTTYWMAGHADIEDQKIVEVFIEGKSTTQYFIDDLVSDKSKLFQSVSHTLWYNKMFVTNDTLFILTLEDRVVRISLETGKIIDRLNPTDCVSCNTSNQPSEPKTIIYEDIKYPKGYIFPDLADGRTFREGLALGLKKTLGEKYVDCKYHIMVYAVIDKLGNCEIYKIHAEVDRNENEEWKIEFSNWVTTQKFKTDLIPENCDKWVFQESLFLN